MKLLSALEDLQHRCSSLAEENSLLVSRGCGPVPCPGWVLGWLLAWGALWGRSPGQGSRRCQHTESAGQAQGGKEVWVLWVS